MKIDYLELNKELKEKIDDKIVIYFFTILIVFSGIIFFIFIRNSTINFNDENMFNNNISRIVFAFFSSFLIGLLSSCILIGIIVPNFYTGNYNTEHNIDIMKKYKVSDINKFKHEINFIEEEITYVKDITDKYDFINNILNIIYNDYVSDNQFEKEIALRIINNKL